MQSLFNWGEAYFSGAAWREILTFYETVNVHVAKEKRTPSILTF